MEDWATFYSNAAVSRWGLPCAEHVDMNLGVIRKLHVAGADLPAPDSPEQMAMVLICCDVLTLDRELSLNAPIIVFARRIEIVGDNGITLGRDGDLPVSLEIATQDIVDRTSGARAKLPVRVIYPPEARSDDPLVELEFGSGAADGVTAVAAAIKADADRWTPTTPGLLARDYLGTSEPLSVFATTLFQVATLLSTDRPELAYRQLSWIAALASRHAASRDLAADATSLAQTVRDIHAQGDGVTLVPYLDFAVYAQSSSICMTLLTQRQQRYDDLIQATERDERWVEDIETALADRENEYDVAVRLVDQAAKTADEADNARRIAAHNLINQRDDLADKEATFSVGIEQWKRDEQFEAAIDIAKNVIGLVSELPTIISAGPGGVAELASSAGDLVSTVGSLSVDLSKKLKTRPKTQADPDDDDDDMGLRWLFDEDDGLEDDFVMVEPDPAAESWVKARKEEKKAAEKEKADRAEKKKQLVASVKNAAGNIKGIYDGAMRIQAATEKAERLHADSQETLDKVVAGVERSFGSIEPIGLDVATGGKQDWEYMRLEMENTFELMGDLVNKVDGGNAYRQAVRALLITGEAMSDARLALAKANSDLAQAIIRRDGAQKAVELYRKRRDAMKDKVQHDEILTQVAFGRVLEAKRAVYMAMEAYTRAFRYFTLEVGAKALELPAITDPVRDFQRKVAKISGREMTATALGSPPSSLDRTLTLERPDLAQQLTRSKGSIDWTISRDEGWPANTFRYRVGTVRAFLDGVSSEEPVSVTIRNNGVLRDALPQRGRADFVAQPLRRAFVYRIGEEESPEIDGNIDPRFAYDFYRPTPFTCWTFTFEKRSGAPLDFSGVTALRFRIIGEVST